MCTEYPLIKDISTYVKIDIEKSNHVYLISNNSSELIKKWQRKMKLRLMLVSKFLTIKSDFIILMCKVL